MKDRDGWVEERNSLCSRKMTAEVGYFAGLVLKDLFVPEADSGLKTCHIRFRCLVAFQWADASMHEIGFSIGELVRMMDNMWHEVQRLWPNKDWKSIKTPEDWESLQQQITDDLT